MSPIDSADSTTVRAAARDRGAPPSVAPVAPRPINASNDTAAVNGMRTLRLGRTTESNGMRPPIVNASAEIHAAWVGTGRADLGDAELVARVRAELVVRHELLGDEAREPGLDAALLVDLRQLAQLAAAVLRDRLRFDGEVSPLGVALRADRDVLADRHGGRARHQSGQGRGQQCGALGIRGGDTDHEAGHRQDPVVGAQHGGAQPACAMALVMLGADRDLGHAGTLLLRARFRLDSGSARRCASTTDRLHSAATT